jgi:hypothetical protein
MADLVVASYRRKNRRSQPLGTADGKTSDQTADADVRELPKLTTPEVSGCSVALS